MTEAEAIVAAVRDAVCKWTPDEEGVYSTDCGHAFQFFDGTPTDNSLKFCSYCGGRLIDVPFTERQE